MYGLPCSWSLSGWCSSSCMTFSSDLTPLDHSTETETRISFFFFIMKLSENRFRVFWRSGCEVNSSYCDLRDGRPNVHAVLVLFKIAFFCSAADDTRLQRSEFSHIKWISSSLFQYVSFISLTELRCRAAVEELWKRTKDLCTEKTVTVKDNP